MFRRGLAKRLNDSKVQLMESTAALSQPAANVFPVAVQVKQHCTIALVKYSQVPAEVYVHRGVAYLELNQPYFALADFRCASERGLLDPKYELLVRKSIESMPDEEIGVFEASNAHLSMVINPSLPANVEMQEAAGKGRGVFATAPIPVGSVVMKRSQAWLTYPLQEGHCSNCGGALGKRPFACKNDACHEEYCSRECRSSAASNYHGGVCQSRGFQSIELEMYAKYKQSVETGSVNEGRAAAIQLLLLRVLGVALTQKMLPSVLPQIRTLSGKLTYSPATLASSTLDLYRRLTLATGTSTSICFEEFVCVLAKLSNNIFQDEATIYAHIPRAMLNHSCAPNCLDTGGEMVAIAPLSAGEEICTSYYPHLNELPYEMRKAELLRRGMNCGCVKCTADAMKANRRSPPTTAAASAS